MAQLDGGSTMDFLLLFRLNPVRGIHGMWKQFILDSLLFTSYVILGKLDPIFLSLLWQ